MVAAATGWPIDRVSRYAEPPLGERSYVAERAQNTYIHLTKGGATLIEVVGQITGNVPADWDSFYLNGHWIVTASMGDDTAQWTYEPQGNSVHPLNSIARTWMGIQTHESQKNNATDSIADANSVSDGSDTVIIEKEPVRLVAVPSLDLAPDTHEPEEPPAPSSSSSSESDHELPLDIQPTPRSPATKKTKQRGRAKVPSWDEILFGGPKNTD
jgi:hypothetical protein